MHCAVKLHSNNSNHHSNNISNSHSNNISNKHSNNNLSNHNYSHRVSNSTVLWRDNKVRRSHRHARCRHQDSISINISSISMEDRNCHRVPRRRRRSIKKRRRGCRRARCRRQFSNERRSCRRATFRRHTISTLRHNARQSRSSVRADLLRSA